MAIPARAFAIGDCNQCGDENVGLFVRHGRLQLCKKCAELEANLPKSPIQLQEDVRRIQEESRKIDSSITIKQELYIANTIPMIELKSAILQNVEIKDADKNYAYLKELVDRVEKLSKVIAADEEAITAKKHARYAMEQEIRQSIVNQTDSRRREFQKFDNKYEVQKPTTAKIKAAAKSPTEPAKFRMSQAGMEELNRISKDSGLPVAHVKMIWENMKKLFDSPAEAVKAYMAGMAAKK